MREPINDHNKSQNISNAKQNPTQYTNTTSDTEKHDNKLQYVT